MAPSPASAEVSRKRAMSCRARLAKREGLGRCIGSFYPAGAGKLDVKSIRNGLNGAASLLLEQECAPAIVLRSP